MKRIYYLLPVFFTLASFGLSMKQALIRITTSVQVKGPFDPFMAKKHPVLNTSASIIATLHNITRTAGTNVSITDDLQGGNFTYRHATSGLTVDNGIIFRSKDGGFWERETADTVKLAWYNLSTKNADNATILKNGIQAAINRKASVVTFPSAGTYRVRSGNYWTVADKAKLLIDGKGALIVVDKQAAAVAQETYVMAFRCAENSNSLNSNISIRNLNITAPDIKPQWTNSNYGEHKLVVPIETDGIHTVDVANCKLDDICGYGIRLKNFVSANVNGVTEKNVGGHFPIENGFDSFGDGIWLGHYDVETVRTSRKKSYAKITNCLIQGYNTSANGNFASRCGITVEGFRSHAPDIVVNVDVTNCIISDYDRNLHVEGISSALSYTNCKIRNFFGIALVINSPKTTLTYAGSEASKQLPPNSRQERLGLGGPMQFSSTFDLFLTRKTVFRFSGAATLRANLHIGDGSVLDFGNSDLFFDHANVYITPGGAMINLPARVSRGYNMYGGSVEVNGGVFKAFNKAPNDKGRFHGENIAAASLRNCKLDNTELFFTGGFGTVEKK